MLVSPEEPAMHEFVDFGVVDLDGKTAVTGPTARSTTTHSLCSGFPYNNGFWR
jgi:hypothetical protein